jgi:arsenate reductase (glutaredoxin)
LFAVIIRRMLRGDPGSHKSGAGNMALATEGHRSMSDVTIYHNPSCTTSRKVLAAIRETGVEPRVIEYLKTPPSRAELKSLLGQMNMTPRALLRRRGTPFDELGLADPRHGDDALIDAMLTHPILIERPIVVTDHGVRLCRPPEKLAEILP